MADGIDDPQANHDLLHCARPGDSASSGASWSDHGWAVGESASTRTTTSFPFWSDEADASRPLCGRMGGLYPRQLLISTLFI